MAGRSTFASKVDGWLVSTMLVAALASVFAIASVLRQGLAGYAIAAALPIGMLAIALPIWLLLQTDYALTDEELLVRSGPSRWRVPLRAIRSITPSRSWLSSPALSLDRLRIDYGCARSVMISPRDKERFLSELQARRTAAAQPFPAS